MNRLLNPAQACLAIHVREAVPGQWIVAIEIGNPGDVVYWNHKAYRSSGTSSTELDAHEVMELRMGLPGLADFSAQPRSASMDAELLQHFAQRVAARNQEDPSLRSVDASTVLQALSLEGRQAARLLFSREVRYRIVKYSSDGEVLSNTSQAGLYRLALPETEDSLDRMCATEVNNQPNLPRRALRESISNAIAHAAYFQVNGDVIIECFLVILR